MSTPLKVFITYSHNDRHQNTELKTRLAVMESEGKIKLWDDNEILPGDEWYKDISTNLAASDILLYLVSATSLASKNCNKELAEALTAKMRVIPIILESCDWLNHQLSDLQALPDKGKPINKWQPESDGWQNVVDGIRETVKKMQTQSDSSSETSERELRAELAFQRGNVLMMIGQVDMAIERYSHAIELDSNDADTYNNRGAAYHIKRDHHRAIEDYTKAIKLEPGVVSAYNNRGVTYREQGDYDRAIGDYTKAIQLNPDPAEVYINRGNAYRNKGDYDRAIDDYTKVIQKKPNDAEIYYNRGRIYGNKKDLDRAIEDYTIAIDLNPDYADAYTCRGAAYHDKLYYDRAIDDFTKVIQKKPNDAGAYNNRGIVHRDKGNFDRAIEDCNKAIDLNPDYADAYNNRGIVYGNMGDIGRAIVNFTQAIQCKPDFVPAYSNCGIAYYRIGDYNRAIENYTRVIDLDPNNAIAYYSRGETWLHFKEWEKAKSDLTIARNIGLDIIAVFHNAYGSVEAYERANRVKLPEDIAAMLTQRRRSRYPKTEKFLSADGTPVESLDVLSLLAKLRSAGTPLAQYVQTRPTFGLKTGRQEAFVVDAATRDLLIAEHPASADILKPFLHGRDIRRWGVARPDIWLIFSYRRIEIDRYPAIRQHLEKYRSALRKRAGKQKWYELPTSKNDTEFLTQTKLICPNSYDHQTFAVDTEGFYCGDTCYLIPTEETWLCGLLNSRVVEWFYSQTSKQLTGDYLQARSRYIQEIPIPDLTSTQKAVIGKIVDYLIFLQGQPTTSGRDLAHARDFIMLGYFERIIDGLVYESYLGEELHQGEKQFFKPLFDERLPHLEEIRGDKMAALREIFERLYERTHPVRRNLFFLDSVKPIRIIEGKA